jgi:myotubularin-related protein 9
LHCLLVKVVTVCYLTACYDVNTTSEKWLSKLDSCGWMSHIKDALTAACVAAQCVDRESAMVIIHGSDGTDTTLIVTSLSQLILDPDCRTITGLVPWFIEITTITG